MNGDQSARHDDARLAWFIVFLMVLVMIYLASTTKTIAPGRMATVQLPVQPASDKTPVELAREDPVRYPGMENCA